MTRRWTQTGWFPTLAPTAVKTADYLASPGEFVPADTTSAPVIITLPAGPPDGTLIGVGHVVQGGTNAVTVTCGSGDVFNKTGGSTTISLPSLNQAVTVRYMADLAIWYRDGVDPSGFAPLSYSALIGNGVATAITVTHNLNKTSVTWSVLDVAAADYVIPTVTQLSANALRFTFAVAPTANQYRVTVSA